MPSGPAKHGRELSLIAEQAEGARKSQPRAMSGLCLAALWPCLTGPQSTTFHVQNELIPSRAENDLAFHRALLWETFPAL